MANDLNTVTLVGRLTRDPELRSLASGTAVCDVRLAYTTSKKVNGEWTDQSNFIDVSVWGGQGEALARNLSKGRRIGVQGRLEWREWQAKDGSTRSTTSVVADRVQYLDPKTEGDSAPAAARQPVAAAASESIPY